MYYGYCFTSIDGYYKPKVRLQNAREAFLYCQSEHLLFPEIRVTDEDDFCVMHVVNHVIYVPLEDGSFRALNYITREERDLTKEQMEAEIEAQKVSQ